MRSRNALFAGVMEWIVNFGVYVLPGLIAQALLLTTTRIHRYPSLLVFNWFLIGVAVLWKCSKALEIKRTFRLKAED